MNNKNIFKFVLLIFVTFSILVFAMTFTSAQPSPWSVFVRITKAEYGKSNIGERVVVYTNNKIKGTNSCGELSQYMLVLNLKNRNSRLIEYKLLRSNSFGKLSDVSFQFGGCIQLKRDMDQSPQPFYPLIVGSKTR